MRRSLQVSLIFCIRATEAIKYRAKFLQKFHTDDVVSLTT